MMNNIKRMFQPRAVAAVASAPAGARGRGSVQRDANADDEAACIENVNDGDHGSV
jgi:hypothetical protein